MITEERSNRQANSSAFGAGRSSCLHNVPVGRSGANRSVSIPLSLGPAGDVVESRPFAGEVAADSWPYAPLAAVLLPAYVLRQVVPLPTVVLRVLLPARLDEAFGQFIGSNP